MNDLSTLYWIARCDECGKPITAHAMSMLREAMLCLDCLNAEAQAMAAQRVAAEQSVPPPVVPTPDHVTGLVVTSAAPQALMLPAVAGGFGR